MASKSEQSDNVIVLDAQAVMVPLSIIIGAVIIAAVLFFTREGSTAGTKVVDTSGDSVVANNDANDVAAPEGNVAAQVGIDDDPIMGDRDTAKVAIVEFSDYECPFCKSFHQQTLSQIVENYIDSGDVIMVYRDFPLSFHDPLATTEAMAAECVQDKKGDAAYYTFGEALYDKTNSNGAGITEDDLYALGDLVGVSAADLKACVDSGDFADEVVSDTNDGIAAGVSGTPGFIVGTLNSDGTVDGEVVSGAQPFSVFQSVIDGYLQ